jgi:hypothetical protein
MVRHAIVGWNGSSFSKLAPSPELPRRKHVKIQLSIDRFEGDHKEIAVLLTDDGEPIDFPRSLLPKGIRAGDILSFKIERDEQAKRALVEKTRKIRQELKRRDPGGDITL